MDTDCKVVNLQTCQIDPRKLTYYLIDNIYSSAWWPLKGPADICVCVRVYVYLFRESEREGERAWES